MTKARMSTQKLRAVEPARSAVHAMAQETSTSVAGVARAAVVAALRARGVEMEQPRVKHSVVPPAPGARPALWFFISLSAEEDRALRRAAAEANVSLAAMASILASEGVPILRASMEQLTPRPIFVGFKDGVSRKGLAYTLCVRPDHPCSVAIAERAAKDSVPKSSVLVDAICAWLRQHGVETPSDTSTSRGPAAAPQYVSIPSWVRAAVETVCERLRIGVTDGAIAAVAAWLGVAPGVYVLPTRTGTFRYVIRQPDGTMPDVCTAPEGKPRRPKREQREAHAVRDQARFRQLAELDAEFIRRRDESSRLPEVSGLMQPRPPVSREAIAAMARRLTAQDETRRQWRSPVPRHEAVDVMCRFCGSRPRALRDSAKVAYKEQSCETCWVASKDGLSVLRTPRPHRRSPRIDWLKARGGVTLAEAEQLARQAATLRAEKAGLTSKTVRDAGWSSAPVAASGGGAWAAEKRETNGDRRTA